MSLAMLGILSIFEVTEYKKNALSLSGNKLNCVLLPDLGPYSRNDDPRSRMREASAVSF